MLRKLCGKRPSVPEFLHCQAVILQKLNLKRVFLWTLLFIQYNKIIQGVGKERKRLHLFLGQEFKKKSAHLELIFGLIELEFRFGGGGGEDHNFCIHILSSLVNFRLHKIGFVTCLEVP